MGDKVELENERNLQQRGNIKEIKMVEEIDSIKGQINLTT